MEGRKRSLSHDPHMGSTHIDDLAGRPMSLSTSEHSSGSKRASKTSIVSSNASSPDLSSTRLSLSSRSVKEDNAPFYASDEARMEVMRQAMEAEQEFLDYIKTLNIKEDEEQHHNPYYYQANFSTGSPMTPSSPLNKMGFFDGEPERGRLINNRGRRMSRSPSKTNSNPRVMGLDQLDNLCKLMEELSSLREQNSKLQLRVKCLEEEKENTEFSVSSVTSMSLQNSPEISTVPCNLKIASSVSPLNTKERSSSQSLSIDHAKMKKLSYGGPKESLGFLSAKESNKESRSKSFCTIEQAASLADSSSMVKSSNDSSEATLSASNVAKAKTLSNWTKVMVDAFKPNKNLSSMTIQTEEEKPMVGTQESETGRYFSFASSSSSSSEEIEFLGLYDWDDLNMPISTSLSVHRSSSFTTSSSKPPDPFKGRTYLTRRHSLTSVNEKVLCKFSSPKPPVITRIVQEPTKKEAVSAWDKVKNMIYTRRDSLKKKSLQKTSSVDKSHDSFDKNDSNIKGKKDQTSSQLARDQGAIPKNNAFKTEANSNHDKAAPGQKKKAGPQLTITTACGDEQSLKGTGLQGSLIKSSPESKPGSSGSDPLQDKRAESHWNKVKKAFLAPPQRKEYCEDGIESSQSLPGSPSKDTSVFFFDDLMLEDSKSKVSAVQNMPLSEASLGGDIKGEIQKSYHELQRSISQEFNKKMKVWEQQRRQKGDPPISPSRINAEANLPPEFRRKYEAWQRQKGMVSSASFQSQNESQVSNGSSVGILCHEDFAQRFQSPRSQDSQEQLPQEFKQKLEAWTRMKEKGYTKDDCVVYKGKKIRARPLEQKQIQEEDLKPEFRLKVAEWEVMKVMAGQSSKKVEDIQKMMPDDFNRKLKEWELMKVTKPSGITRQERKLSNGQLKKKKSNRNEHKRRYYDKYSDKLVRLEPTGLSRPRSSERDSAWLEKELLKVQREKERLEREREKFTERERKLQKMKEALEKQKQETKEITVKTSKGEEFRFGGISEKFTQKLYEWEEQKKIAPELSTIALLNPFMEKEKQQDSMEMAAESAKGLPRSKSEGSLTDPSAVIAMASDGQGLKDAGGGNGSQNSSQSLNDLDKKTEQLGGQASFLEGGEAKTSSGSGRADSSVSSKKVQLSRTDSVRTQASIQILEENLSLINTLQARGEIFRELESTLQKIGGDVSNVVKSTLELTQIKKEEESDDEADEKLITHLGLKLKDLEREKGKLLERQQTVQDSLAAETEIQKKITSAIIDRIESFSRANPVTRQLVAPLATGEKEKLGIDFVLLQSIHELSEQLAEETKELAQSLNPSQTTEENMELQDKASGNLPSHLIEIMQHLKVCMLELLKRQMSVWYPVKEPKPPERKTSSNLISSGPRTFHLSSSAAKLYIPPRVRTRSTASSPRCFSKSKTMPCTTIVPLSMSESDLSCGEISASYRFLDTDEESNSRISSNNSMSRYGSESPIHAMMIPELQPCEPEDHSIGILSGQDETEELLSFRFQMLESDDEQQKAQIAKYCKQRRHSSDNISTPNSGRSRSPSILSSDIVTTEEETSNRSRVPDCSPMVKQVKVDKKDQETSEKIAGDKKEVSMTNIDEVCQLIRELKEQDLKRHKKKIEEHQERLKEKSKSTQCSSDESSAFKKPANFQQDTISQSSSETTTVTQANVKPLSSVKLIMQANKNLHDSSDIADKFSSAPNVESYQLMTQRSMPIIEQMDSKDDVRERPELKHVFVPTMKMRLYPPEDVERASKESLRSVRITSSEGREPDKVSHEPVRFIHHDPKAEAMALRARAEALSSAVRFKQHPRTDFLRLEAEKKNFWKPVASAVIKSPEKQEKFPNKRNLSLPITRPLSNLVSPHIQNESNRQKSAPPARHDASGTGCEQSLENLIQSVRSRSPSLAKINSGSDGHENKTEAQKSAELRMLQNQKARENFLFGMSQDSPTTSQNDSEWTGKPAESSGTAAKLVKSEKSQRPKGGTRQSDDSSVVKPGQQN